MKPIPRILIKNDEKVVNMDAEDDGNSCCPTLKEIISHYHKNQDTPITKNELLFLLGIINTLGMWYCPPGPNLSRRINDQ